MIVTQIYGGLGNQMFQYAVGRVLSLVRHVALVLDISEFDAKAQHQGFELDRVFGLNTRHISRQQLLRLFGWRVNSLPQRLAARWPHFPLADKRIIIEPHLDYWSGIDDAPSTSYLRGFWQSEQYFQACEDLIRSDFQFKAPLMGQALDWAGQMQLGQSVSLHIRRGDYIENSATRAYHGVCSLDYYMQAVAAIASQVSQPKFFVFSDDLDWARDNLRIDYPVHFVNGNEGVSSYRDMQLMSLCRHHIIANSSFSWWGAWLNARTDKMVFAPARWFASRSTPKSLYPDHWTVL